MKSKIYEDYEPSGARSVEFNVGKSIFLFAICFIVIMGVSSSAYMIKAGQRGVLLTFGKASDIAVGEGLHFKVPFAQKIVKMDVKTQKYEAEAAAASKDLQTVTTNIAVNYRLSPESVPKLYREVGLDYQTRIIQPLEQEVVKATTATFTAEELITRREEVRIHIRDLIAERLSNRDIIVEEVSITNFDFSDSFNAAIEAKVTAEQNALAAKNKLEQIKYEAEQRVTQATAEAQAIRIQAEAIRSQGGAEYVQLQAISKWNGILPQFTGGGAIPFIQVPSTTA